MVVRRLWLGSSSFGMLRNSASVYGIFMSEKSTFVDAFSTMRPAYMTITSSVFLHLPVDRLRQRDRERRVVVVVRVADDRGGRPHVDATGDQFACLDADWRLFAGAALANVGMSAPPPMTVAASVAAASFARSCMIMLLRCE